MTKQFNTWSLICSGRFVVSNGKTSRNGSFEITVEMVDRILPSLSTNKGLSVPQGSTVILGPDCLALSDPDTPPSALTFVLLQPPQYGRLLLGSSTLTAGSNFTQRNIQESYITYKHDGGPSQIDQFAFTASDSTNGGFLLDEQLHTAPVFFIIQVGGGLVFRGFVSSPRPQPDKYFIMLPESSNDFNTTHILGMQVCGLVGSRYCASFRLEALSCLHAGEGCGLRLWALFWS